MSFMKTIEYTFRTIKEIVILWQNNKYYNLKTAEEIRKNQYM
jgi:hypothetical protein